MPVLTGRDQLRSRPLSCVSAATNERRTMKNSGTLGCRCSMFRDPLKAAACLTSAAAARC